MRFFNGLAVGAAALALSLAAGGTANAQLTVWGAEAGGNADGSIPAWQGAGGLTTIVNDKVVDPFSGDSPQFVIDGSNYTQYSANLTDGQKAMFKKYPSTFKMPVYQTRRVFDLPQWAQDAIRAEQGQVKLAGDTGLQNLDRSNTPFPQPQNGLQAVWNHITRYRAGKVLRNYYQIPVQQNGSYTAQRLTDRIIFRAALEKTPDNDNMLIKFLQVFNAPAQLEGNVLLVHEFIDQVKQPRAAWLYNPGQRRVRRAPNVAYDGPANGAEGLRTTDDFDMYNGSPNKFTWKLLGKRELYLPANGFRLATAPSIDSLMTKNHMNPDFARYEKRRAWVVEAKLKPSERHIYSRRVFYMDEDGWIIALKDLYDSRGNLWRVGELHTALFSTTKSAFNTGEPQYDLQAGRWLMLSAVAGQNPQFALNANFGENLFTPGALRRLGRK